MVFHLLTEVARILDCEFTVSELQIAVMIRVIIKQIWTGFWQESRNHRRRAINRKTVSKTISTIKEAGGDVGLVIVLVNKTMRNEIGDVPLRGVIRCFSLR